MQGIQENLLRSLLNVNEEEVYRSMTQQLPAICVFFCVFFYLVGNKSFIPPNEPRTEEAS